MNSIELPRDKRPEFPDECIACLRESPGGTTRLHFSTWRQAEGTPLAMVLPQVAVDVPACARCGRRLQIGRKTRNLIQSLILFASILTCYLLFREYLAGYWLMLATAAPVIVLITIYTLLESKLFPPPFDMLLNRDTIEYEFRDEAYARKFAYRSTGAKQAFSNLLETLDRIEDDDELDDTEAGK